MEANLTGARKMRSTMFFVLIAAFLAGGGCATGRKSLAPTAGGPGNSHSTHVGEAVAQPTSTPSAPGNSEVLGPPEPYGPQQPTQEVAYGPEPMQVRPLVLVFSPGVVKGFAHSGVLEALSVAKVPIGAVLGAEMGALIAALYAKDGSVNHLQWNLMKFREEVFLSEKGLFATHKLESELSKTFGANDIRDGKIPCVVALEVAGSGALELVNHGPAKEALRAAIAFPEIVGPGNWNGNPAISSRKGIDSLIHEARSLGIGPVVLVELGSGHEAARVDQDVDLVIRPDVRGVQDLDFKKRSEAIFRGKKAVADNLKEILHWAGMPQGER